MMRFLAASTLALSLLSGGAWADGFPKRGSIASPAQTEGTFDWSGVYLDLGAGGQVTDTTLGIEALKIEGFSGFGGLGNARVGLDYRMPSTNLVAGIFAGYSFGEAETTLSFGQNSINATMTPTWEVGAKIGAVVGTSLWYTGYRYQEADFSLGTSPASDLRWSDTKGGHGLILGVAQPLAKGVTFGMEYGATWFDDIGPQGITADVLQHSLTARLAFRPQWGQ